MYIQKGLTLWYTTQALNLFNSHSFSNERVTLMSQLNHIRDMVKFFVIK